MEFLPSKCDDDALPCACDFWRSGSQALEPAFRIMLNEFKCPCYEFDTKAESSEI